MYVSCQMVQRELITHSCFRLGLERCRAPGAGNMALPFVCPLDYVFDPGQFDDAGRQHGTSIDIRDHNFFQHPELPQKLKVQLTVHGDSNPTELKALAS